MAATDKLVNLSQDVLRYLTRDSKTTILSASIAALFAYLLLSSITQYFRLRHIPGPPGAGFSKWWLIGRITSGRTHLDYYEVCEKYGPIARVGPNDLVTSDPDLIKRMSNVRSDYRRSDWYNSMRFNPSKDNVVSMRDDDLHNKLRAKLAAGYSGREIDDLEAKIDRHILALVDLLKTSYVAKNRAFDFGRKCQYLTLDILSDIAYSDPFGFIAGDSDKFDYIKTIEENFPTIIVVTVLPWIITMMRFPLFKMLPGLLPSEKDRLGLGKVMGITKKVAAERYGPNKKVKRDMLGSFVNHGLTEEEAESETLIQVIAGSDTTAGAIRGTMLFVMTNPHVVNTLRSEIASHKIPSDRVITNAEALAMPYLQAVIKEGLRMFPPITGLMSKQVPPQGDTFKGIWLPGGTKIGNCTWGLLRRKDVWGEDSDSFRPERWLEAAGEKLKEMESVVDLVFGFGKYQCLGRNIAFLELNKVFVELVRRFDFAIVNPEKPWQSRNTGIFLQSDYWVRGYLREE
ncbi:pisatin demethylase [Coniochaeta sp. PMI_546]|nr:pisatin demethylase [Coniochaeta sp. PMI_546]